MLSSLSSILIQFVLDICLPVHLPPAQAAQIALLLLFHVVGVYECRIYMIYLSLIFTINLSYILFMESARYTPYIYDSPV